MTSAANIIVPLLEIGLDRREVTYADDWYPPQPIRYQCEIFGLPALVQLRTPSEGTQWVDWCLNPKGADAAFEGFWNRNERDWPGDIWGIAMIDRRIRFAVDADLPIRYRKGCRSLLDRFPRRGADELRMAIDWAA